MNVTNFKRTLSQVYLTLVPILTVILGLGVGYVSYKIYLPIWLANVSLMILSMWTLGAHVVKRGDTNKKHLVACAAFFIIPTLLTSMFAGLGAPPYESPKLWVASVTEQRVRYYFLLVAGLFIAFGFALLRQKLKKEGENFYSIIGDTIIKIAVPVFLISMSFWGFYLTRLYQQMVTSNIEKTPDWVLPLRTQFYYVDVIACGLFYLGTAAFVMASKHIGLFKTKACNVYLVLSLLFFLLDVLPPTLPEPFATLNFIVSIPAVPFFFPYFIGINLLRKARD